ncbi:hypothetical protein KSO91_12500 [Psychromonas antarctica]|nr:hypothetical protein [Psychromonas antarctica]MCG6202052.1 hypothetical protein [Psychromonas antarctica]
MPVSIDIRALQLQQKDFVDRSEIIGKGHSGTLPDHHCRASNQFHCVYDKSAKTVTAATISLLKLFKDAVLTITADNEQELAYHEELTKDLQCDLYLMKTPMAYSGNIGQNQQTSKRFRDQKFKM